ncbi:cadherin, partial [Candidatus Magnetomorum sp. HK-1]
MKLSLKSTKMFNRIFLLLSIMMIGGLSFIGHASATGTLSPIVGLYDANENQVVQKPNRLLLISSDIDNPNTKIDESILLQQVASNDTIAFVYDPKSETLEKLVMVIEKIMIEYGVLSFESIALATHGQPGGFCITDGQCLSLKTIYNPLLNNFWSNISQFSSNRIDLMGCFLGKNTALLSKLSQQTQRTITASTNITGSPEKNGDWFLEVGEIDLGKTYFSKELLTQVRTIELNP